MGRRVSFAATAHVRFFERENSKESPQPAENPFSPCGSPCDADRMELTTNVGKILEKLPSFLQEDEEDEADMDMTVPLQNVIVQAGRKSPKSPSILKSPKKSNDWLVQDKKIQWEDSEISFIEDSKQPATANDLFEDLSIPNFDVETATFDFLKQEDAINTQELKNLLAPIEIAKNPPKQQLKPFLAEIGIRFLDNLSTISRRETMGRPRDSEVFTAAKCANIFFNHQAQLEKYESAAGTLSEMVVDSKDKISAMEEHFNSFGCGIYAKMEHASASEKNALVQQLKLVKSWGRIVAKGNWYNWRSKVQKEINEKLNENLHLLKNDKTVLCNRLEQINQVCEAVNAEKGPLSEQYNEMRQRKMAFMNIDWDKLRRLECGIEEQKAQIDIFENDFQDVKKQEEEFDAEIKLLQERKAQLLASIEKAKEICTSSMDISDSELMVIKSS